MTTINNEKQTSTQLTLVNFVSFQKLLEKKEEEIKVIIQHWIRILNVKVGWIHDFDKFVVNYVMFICVSFNMFKFLFAFIIFFMLDTFRSSSKLMNTLTGHTDIVWGIDYLTVDSNQLICSVSNDKTVRVWDVDNNEQIQLFNGHSDHIYCVKLSPYHYYTNGCNVICSSSQDRTIRFWDLKKNQQLRVFNEHKGWVGGIEFSPFNGGRYLFSGSMTNYSFMGC
ncbi:hypothetical protein RFI_29459 [Reticulomyxa filosa]|uniref:Uncharacterized protein n=1 Tax=Reticulomyxa filosa TaxID=46433 RepID=X6M2V9_RETFI|nr:hypothetical protein RFI_29459 [Reticulomyxa filosa]|eukprot:ETO07931.1 hypothetical protein RFI_29459 [Reticulomyxa filosa]